ncbi:unnamed protein product, partial [Rotaria magnacalcarata]
MGSSIVKGAIQGWNSTPGTDTKCKTCSHNCCLPPSRKYPDGYCQLSLMTCFTNGSKYPLPNPMLDRFCFKILPEIHHKIRWLKLKSLSMKRILLATNYPNLYGLGLYELAEEITMSFFN